MTQDDMDNMVDDATHAACEAFKLRMVTVPMQEMDELNDYLVQMARRVTNQSAHDYGNRTYIFIADIRCFSQDDEESVVLRRFPVSIETEYGLSDATDALPEIAGDIIFDMGSDLLDWPAQRVEVLKVYTRDERDPDSPREWLRRGNRAS